MCMEVADRVLRLLPKKPCIQIAAAAKINTGANFVVRNSDLNRRLDWVIDPDGKNVIVTTVDENLRVTVDTYNADTWPLAERVRWLAS